MDGIISLLIFLVLFLVSGAVFGWIAFFRINTLTAQLKRLEERLSFPVPEKPTTEPEQHKTGTQPLTEDAASIQGPAANSFPDSPVTDHVSAHQAISTASEAKPWSKWLASLGSSWMIWLGGLCVALAGVFMVKFSIDQGLLGPSARVALGLATGIGLHILAEWLRRRQGGSDPVFAALAGGASITLYAALLAALMLYQLLDPRWAFGLLAAVSLVTMALALVHGPVLALIGLVGGYVVPILVSDNSGNVVGALIYSLIISAASLALLRYVFRPWLWWGMVAGALGWWVISMTGHQADSFRAMYLALLAWGVLAIPAFDWSLLKGSVTGQPDPGSQSTVLFNQQLQLHQVTLGLLVLAWGVTIFFQGFEPGSFGLWGAMVLIICLAARQRDSVCLLPWLTLVVQWVGWLLSAVKYDAVHEGYVLAGLSPAIECSFLAFSGVMASLYVVLALLHMRARGISHVWMSLALLSPLVWLGLCYLLVNGVSQSLQWGLIALIGGGAYALVAGIRLQQDKRDGTALWFTLGAHFAYSLAVSIYFREAGLTLALSAQLLSLTWALKRYELPWLGTLVKVLIGVVVIRLTLNPWLLSYPADIHWSLWTYGGATLFTALAAWQSRSSPQLQRWLEATALHLLVLTLAAELRYWLYDGQIFVRRYGLIEASINASLWSGMALTYYRRSMASQHLAALYRSCSRVLLGLSLASYLVVVCIHNPWWHSQVISPTPIFNLLLLAYGLPVVMAALVAVYHEACFRKLAVRVAALAVFVFINLEIRHLWQGGGSLKLTSETADGEIYTYSVVWMLMAIAGLLTGTAWRQIGIYRAGMAMLALVIAKIFLVDMSGLEGLWRVASFMGLGLSLLGLAWLHNHFRQPAESKIHST